jgi:hypothetical protein
MFLDEIDYPLTQFEFLKTTASPISNIDDPIQDSSFSESDTDDEEEIEKKKRLLFVGLFLEYLSYRNMLVYSRKGEMMLKKEQTFFVNFGDEDFDEKKITNLFFEKLLQPSKGIWGEKRVNDFLEWKNNDSNAIIFELNFLPCVNKF